MTALQCRENVEAGACSLYGKLEVQTLQEALRRGRMSGKSLEPPLENGIKRWISSAALPNARAAAISF